MYTTVDFQNFQRAFQEIKSDKFSYEGLKTLFEMLEDLEYETRKESEFDIVSVCSSHTEYGSFEDLVEEYDEITTIDDLADKTRYKMMPGGGLIIQNITNRRPWPHWRHL